MEREKQSTFTIHNCSVGFFFCLTHKFFLLLQTFKIQRSIMGNRFYFYFQCKQKEIFSFKGEKKLICSHVSSLMDLFLLYNMKNILII